MRASVIQLQPGCNKASNIAQADSVVTAAVQQDAPRLVALPEMWTCLGGTREQKLVASEVLPAEGQGGPGGEAYEFLRELARRHRLYVHGGSLAERVEEAGGAVLFNTTVVFGPDGDELARYRKIHLFDIIAPDGSGYRESAMFGGGRQVITCDAAGLRLGLAICYDLRFAELFLALRQLGSDVIVLPAAFTVPTGRDHWEVLLRARAIETQCWVVAPATVGHFIDANGGQRATYGHSLVCDPWGRVVASVDEGIGFATADLDLALNGRVRRDMPVLEHRVLDQAAPAGWTGAVDPSPLAARLGRVSA